MSFRSVSLTSPSLAELATVVRTQFEDTYGSEPSWVVAAPGRVNLIGEHVDYNEGFVLPMAIERYTVIAAAPSANHSVPTSDVASNSVVTMFSEAMQEQCTASLFELTPERAQSLPLWARYVAGTIALCGERGLLSPSLDLYIASTVPLGGGLSSSASLEVATATLCEAISGQSLPPLEKVQLCQRAEHQYAQVPCGIMDQSAVTRAVESHLLLLDCRSLEIQLIPVVEPAPQILIINSNVKHELGNSEYAVRRQECEAAARALGVRSLRDASLEQLEVAKTQLTSIVYRRARHVISEIDRTQAAAQSLLDRDWHRAGELMYASHASLRDDYEVSCRELDILVELAAQQGKNKGVFGSRMTGGGFGGCTVSLVDADAVEQVVAAIADGYQRATSLAPTLFVTRPATGARIFPSENKILDE